MQSVTINRRREPVASCAGFILALAIAPLAAQPHGQETADAAALSVKKLQIVEGLKADLFASDPLLYNPVAFSIDEKGRFFVSETHRYKTSIFDIWAADARWKQADASFRTVGERAGFLAQEFATNLTRLTKDSELIRVVEDRDGDGRADASAVFAAGFDQTVSGTAAGVLARKGEVWFTCIPDLWRFTFDPAKPAFDEDPAARSRELLHTGYGVHIGVSGHDLHGLVMGPDGRLYFSVGDRGARVTTREGKVLDTVDTGAVFRCDPDGSNLVLFAVGLRNPQELAFDQWGNLWAHDNDTAGEDKSRVLHVVEGADFGWRYSYQFMQGFGPWVQEKVWQGGIDDVLPSAGYGAQGPAGLAYYPGVGLPEKYNHHFLACDFPGGVWSYTVQPRGASYEMVNKEKFVWGFGATDVAFGPDCRVYLSDWGMSYQVPEAGRIYRVFDPEQADNPALAEVKRLLGEGMEARPFDELGRLLGHADMRVRLEAQFELARRAVEGRAGEAGELLEQTALQPGARNARVHALWGLGQIVRHKGAGNTAGLGVLHGLAGDPDEEVRAQLASVLGGSSFKAAGGVLSKLAKDESPRVRFHAVMSLGKTGSREAVAPVLQMLRDNAGNDVYLTHAGVWAMVQLDKFGAIKRAAQDDEAAVRRAALLGMRRMGRAEAARFLDDRDPGLVVDAARAINDAPIPAAMPSLASKLSIVTRTSQSTGGISPDSPHLNDQFLRRAINANFRIGAPSNARVIAEFALEASGISEAMRVEAFQALGDWGDPRPLDRVVGLWRPLVKRDPKPARAALAGIFDRAVKSPGEKVVVAAIESAGKLGVIDAVPSMMALFEDAKATTPARIAILQALAALKSERLGDAVKLALEDPDKAVRREALQHVELLKRPDLPQMLGMMLEKEADVRISQAVLAALGRLSDPAAAPVLAGQMDRLLAGKLKPELQLDLLEAVGGRGEPALREKLAQHKASLPAEDPLASYRSSAQGGSATQGRKIFHENDAAGCLRCHAIKGKGGVVGPDLGTIGSAMTREKLLEAVLLPNREIARGYENVAVLLKNGEFQAGQVVAETADKLVLKSTEDGSEIEIAKDDITAREAGLSAMPEGLGELLTRWELRDLIEYLAQLK